jgi:hypothetical protein
MSVKSRIAKLWAAAAARADTGIKLTGDEALVLHVDDVGAIAKARAEG